MMTVGPGPGQYGPLIYTPAGRLVWFDQLPTGLNAQDLNVQSYEGQSDLTWWQGRVLSLGFGQGEDIVMDPNYQTVATREARATACEADLHDFQLAPRRRRLRHRLQPDALRPVSRRRAAQRRDRRHRRAGDRRQDGLVRWEWHSLDHVGVGESHAPVPTTATPVGLVPPELDRSASRAAIC